jgi:hypothetical protein
VHNLQEDVPMRELFGWFVTCCLFGLGLWCWKMYTHR